MNDLIVGILLAIVAGSVIPFFTAQAAGMIESRRDRSRRRRKLYERAHLALIEPRQQEYATSDEWVAAMQSNVTARNRARSALRSSFALFDGDVAEATTYWGTHVSTPKVDEIMRLWANGNRWTARWKATRLLKSDERVITPPPRSG